MNNDGTVSYNYKQGVYKYSNGLLLEGNKINNLWREKVNIKWEDGNRDTNEMLNDTLFSKEWNEIIIIYYKDYQKW